MKLLRLFALMGPLAGIFLIQSHIDEQFGKYRATEEILYVDNGKLLKRAMLGFENLGADLYWLRTVQYFGRKRLMVTTKNYVLLAPLLRVTVDLDPEMKIAFSYGATFLAEPFPMGAGLPSKGIEIIDEGIRNRPGYWRFYLDKGFIYSEHLGDYKKAASVFLEGSKLEGAPYWMVAIAGRTLTKGGERETSRILWNGLYKSAETEQQRENAATHLQQLDALDEMDSYNEVVTKYHERTGEFPRRWQDLIGSGFLAEVPTDPTDIPYVLDPESHRVVLRRDSGLGGLPTR